MAEARYRTELVEKTIALREGDATTLQLEALGLPGGGYWSTTPLEEVDRYLNYQVRTVFDIRKRKAQPVVERRRD